MKIIKSVLLLCVSLAILTACLSSLGKSGLKSEANGQDTWQTYTNDKYKFTIQFPPVWQVVELPTATYPTVTDQVWFISESLPLPQTDSRADIVLIFSQEDPFASWEPQFFDDYQSDVFWLGDIPARRISGINKESQFSEIVVLAEIGDLYLQAVPNQSEASLEYFDRVIASLRFVQAEAHTPPSSAIRVLENLNEQTITFEGLSFNYQTSLAEGAIALQVPTFVDPSGFMYNDHPEHVRFDFVNPYTLREPFAGFQPIRAPWLNHQNPDRPEIQPQIFILPTSEYTDISPLAAEQIELLRKLLDGSALSTKGELPVLPTFNSAQDFHGQIYPLVFQGGRGLRFITRYSQGVAPVVNPGVFYTFQGLTEDGSLYVAAFFPLYLSLLPDQIQVEDWEAFSRGYQDYMADIASQLEGLEPDAFQPDLASLDALISSLTILEPGMTAPVLKTAKCQLKAISWITL
jgi:hypothetical protein